MLTLNSDEVEVNVTNTKNIASLYFYLIKEIIRRTQYVNSSMKFGIYFCLQILVARKFLSDFFTDPVLPKIISKLNIL